MPINLKLNLGGQGAAPGAPTGWTNVWGLPVIVSDLQQDIDFGNIGEGIGLRTVNNGAPNTWGVNNGTSAHDLGKSTGANTGIYPDIVLIHGWFTNNRTGTIELYNFSGTPLTGKSFTLKLLGSRGNLTQPRTTQFP